jgi:5'-nucleotidase
VKCRDADTSIAAQVDTVVAEGAELVVGLTHLYEFQDRALLDREKRITAILGGHDHDGRRWTTSDGRLMIKAVSNARTAAYVEFERRGARWEIRDRILDIGPGMREQAATAAVVARWRDTLSRRIGPDRVLGIAPKPIDAVDSISKRESEFGNMIVDALRIGTGADVALLNSGAMRYDDVMPAGPITRLMIEAIFLFADETRVLTFPITIGRVRELLEVGVGRGGLGSGPYPQVSGVHFSFDARLPSGARVVGPLRRPNGIAFADTDTVTMSFVSYPSCRGGDGYRVPEAAAACREYEANPASKPRSVDLVLRHLDAMGGRIVTPPIGRVTRLDR